MICSHGTNNSTFGAKCGIPCRTPFTWTKGKCFVALKGVECAAEIARVRILYCLFAYGLWFDDNGAQTCGYCYAP